MSHFLFIHQVKNCGGTSGFNDKKSAITITVWLAI
ncbi:hypothetical protein B0G74_3207 [Paraburkholderia sp. BL9I2N2]|nr:hypothetical protein B0G74_3207 [Paraburkholderia sp. BL9I2N2]